MTKEDIIRMAREAGFADGVAEIVGLAGFERFAALVAAAERKRLEATAWGASKKWIVEAVAAEREACARVCEVVIPGDEYSTALVNSFADSIRARGQE